MPITSETDSVNYFAYGSNLHPERLRARAPSARSLTIAHLPGHVLRWHKRSFQDGSGKCDAYRTDNPEHRLWGAIYCLCVEHLPALDAAEGVGHGYRRHSARLTTDGTAIEAFLYVAEPTAIDPDARPFRWYKELVVAGAEYHGLPVPVVESLRRVAAIEDSDRHRDLLHRKILLGRTTPVGAVPL